jgi:hypothetical protein
MDRAPRPIRIALYLLMATVAIQVAHPVLGVETGYVLTRLVEDWLYNGGLIGAALICVARRRGFARSASPGG